MLTNKKEFIVRTIDEEHINDEVYKKPARLHLKSYDDIEDYFFNNRSS